VVVGAIRFRLCLGVGGCGKYGEWLWYRFGLGVSVGA
jgi:hypothetical protein